MNYFRILLIIGTGGFLGSVLRYLLSLAIQEKIISVFPYGTLAVNILGCLLIGIIYGISEKINLSKEWILFFATGLCGGFTTFSAFSIEAFELLKAGLLIQVLIYVFASLLLGLLATFAGYSILKIF